MKRILSQISILAYYQIIGGIVGLIVTFLTLYDLPVFAIFNVLVVLLIIGLYSFSIYSGIVLLKKKYIKGLNLSIYNNAIQIISVHLFGFYYLYYSGIQFAISIDLTNDTIFGISLWYSNWAVSVGEDSEKIFLSINIIAILLVNFIYNLKARVTKLGDRIYEGEEGQ